MGWSIPATTMGHKNWSVYDGQGSRIRAAARCASGVRRRKLFF
jgi:hypothetical protein